MRKCLVFLLSVCFFVGAGALPFVPFEKDTIKSFSPSEQLIIDEYLQLRAANQSVGYHYGELHKNLADAVREESGVDYLAKTAKPNHTISTITHFNALRERVIESVEKFKLKIVTHVGSAPQGQALVDAIKSENRLTLAKEMNQDFVGHDLRLKKLCKKYYRALRQKQYLSSVYAYVKMQKMKAKDSR